ncbi:kinase-like domain-containing protein, partial [Mycena vitilis]
LLDQCSFRGTECLVYALGGMSLDRLLKTSRLAPLLKNQVRVLSWQIANAVEYLHSIGLIHTDIKPANVVLVSDRTIFVKKTGSNGQEVLVDTSIKVIDLDDAVGVGRIRRWLVGTEQYRAPEVSVGCVWLKAIDAFSLACLLVELFVGVRLFGFSPTPAERLASLERCIGLGPTGYGRIADEAPWFFTRTEPRRVLFDASTCGREAAGRVALTIPLPSIVRWPELLHVCRDLLRLDPEKRITVADALKYPFFDKCASHHPIDTAEDK